jgi:hypothetical protein
MATEALTAQTASRSGAELNMQSVTSADGFTFPNDGRTVLIVTNDAGALELSFTIQKTVDGQTPAAKTATIDASETWVVGPFPVNVYNDADDLVTVTPDADLATGVAVVSYS